MVDIKDATLNLVRDLGCLLLGGECFDGDFTGDEGNDNWSKMDFFCHAVSETG